ncbi:alpha-2-macroglobulin family protein [Lentibacter algarum]|uniref:alpha-2-macroglobulin family protein n=1 Tax=Lentibacter algarum TaxID=576131 RepID=UPI00249095BB|nr:alpha-2-macroglobulin family protein [Lentibacter algarum]
MFRIVAALFLFMVLVPMSQAQSLLPDRHVTVFNNFDFLGDDLQQLFDTDEASCKRACTALDACIAYTFNTKSNACFPKSSLRERIPFEGAKSVEMRSYSANEETLSALRAEELNFLNSYDLANAKSFAEALANKHPNSQWSADAMRDAAFERDATGDALNAWRWMGAVTARTDLARDWADYARLLEVFSPVKTSDQSKYANDAFLASINAYLRAEAADVRTSALLTMSKTLDRRGRGGDTVPALKLASSLSASQDITNALGNARAKYGFRVVENDVDNATDTPRICATFSEPLSKSEQDFTRFVALPDPRFAVEAEERKLCVSGVEFGARYTLTFRAGLPAESGEGLIKDTKIEFYVRDRTPKVSFPGRGYILPSSGEASIPVQTVNAEELDLTLRRVSDRNILRVFQDDLFAKPLYRFQAERLAGDIGEEVWSGTGLTESVLNQDSKTRLPISEAIAGQPAGVYVLSASLKSETDRYGTVAQQWFVLTDIGLSSAAGRDGLHVFAKSLQTAKPLGDIQIQLVSRSNRVLAEARTDSQGVATFDTAQAAGKGGAAPAMVIARIDEKEVTFLSLTDPAFDLSDRGVSGRNPPKALDLFISTDRGAYRAGETVFATALLRDSKAKALEGLPLTAVLLRPDGVEYSRQLSAQDQAGGHVFNLPVAISAPRGSWALELRNDADGEALASATFLVEDFLPERIDFDINIADTELSFQSAAIAEIDAQYLFGAPAADLTIEGRITLSATRSLEAYSGFLFGRHSADFRSLSDTLPFAKTDTTGKARLPLRLPEAEAEGLPLQAQITVQVAEGSGRPVERRTTRPVQSNTPLIGLKPLFDGDVAEDTNAEFDILLLGTDMKPKQGKARWTLNRLNKRYQWYEQNGNWNWEPIITRKRITTGELALTDGRGSVSAPVTWGSYELLVELDGEVYVAASEAFDAGWYADAGAVSTPDTLELSLDATNYTVGEIAQLRVVPRTSGTAMVQVMSDSLISSEMVDLSAGENLIPINVTEAWGTGAYVTVTHISPMQTKDSFLPTRAIGLAYANIDPAQKALEVELLSLEQTKPRQPLEVAVKVGNVTPGETAYVTLAAVDAGILNLTGFEPPAPKEHYFGKRKLGVELRDVYGRLIDASKGNLGRIRSGGDAGSAAGLEGPPPTDELVTFFQGPVTVGSDGLATITLDIPEFNGTLRLMAIAWSRTGVGAANKDIIIRDPVVLSASLPNFLSPDDSSTLRLEITHADGPTGETEVTLEAAGLSLDLTDTPNSVMLQQGQKIALSIPLTATEIGDHEITITLMTPSNVTLSKTLTLPVRRLDPEVSTTRRLVLDAGQSLTLDTNLTQSYRQNTGRLLVSAGPIAKFDVASLLSELDRYPYGCTEQLTSAAMPLLYFSSITEGLGLTSRGDVNERVNTAVARILTRQSSSGSFGLWYPESGDLWLDAYVTDFLSRARTAGVDIPDLAFRNALTNLSNRANSYPDFDEGGGDLAYALYVLAREGQTAVSDLRYYADVKAAAFDTPIGKAQLGAALAYHGDQLRADAMFTQALDLLDRTAGAQRYRWRADYGTHSRDTAAIITLAQDAGSKAIQLADLAGNLAEATNQRSTQEMVWTLLAVDKLLSTTTNVSLNGAPLSLPVLRRTEADLGRAQSLTNTSDTSTDVTLTTFGVPSVAPEASGYGYAIERRYFTLEGAPVETLNVKTGDRLVTHLKVVPFENAAARLMINDPLPAGFEIDNPNLLQSGDIGALSWLKPSRAESTEFRAERFLTAVNSNAGKPVELAYVVRAVTPGQYHHAPATVEDMYRPIYRANTGAGEVIISAD